MGHMGNTKNCFDVESFTQCRIFAFYLFKSFKTLMINQKSYLPHPNCWLDFAPQTDAMTFALPSVSILLLWERLTSLVAGQIGHCHVSYCSYYWGSAKCYALFPRGTASDVNLGSTQWKKDLYRREGKGRRCFLGDRIASNPCCALTI